MLVPAAAKPEISNVPFATTWLELLMAPAPVSARMPTWITVWPVYALAAARFSVPVPILVSPPTPVKADVASVPIVNAPVSIVSPPARMLSLVPENPLMKVALLAFTRRIALSKLAWLAPAPPRKD